MATQLEKWKEVQDVYDYGKECVGCPYYRQWREPRPYGSTEVYEYLRECTVEDPDECQGVN